jgi:hypothetical protein
VRVYYRRSIWGRVLAVLIAIPVVCYLAYRVYQWLLPLLPLAGAGILLIVFVWFGFRRRY